VAPAQQHIASSLRRVQTEEYDRRIQKLMDHARALRNSMGASFRSAGRRSRSNSIGGAGNPAAAPAAPSVSASHASQDYDVPQDAAVGAPEPGRRWPACMRAHLCFLSRGRGSPS
jgi:hypothetical protein